MTSWNCILASTGSLKKVAMIDCQILFWMRWWKSGVISIVRLCINWGHRWSIERMKTNHLPSKHGAFTQCCFNVELASKTVGQHWSSIGWMTHITYPMLGKCWPALQTVCRHRASIGETWRTYTDPWSIKIAYSTALPSMNKSSKRGILVVLLNEWMNKWMNNWMNEWKNKRMN